MAELKLSVCMVTYNHEPYIAQAVESALAQQTEFPFEIVIGDDCSTDRTRAILSDFARRAPDIIRLRLAERNQGARTNFLGTLNACCGKYVAMLEGDDYWTSPQKLQKQVDALEARPDWAICFHSAEISYEDGLSGPKYLPDDWQRPEATLVDLLRENFISTNSVVFRHRLFPQFPDWYFKLTLGDWPLHLLNAAHGNIGYLPEVMSVYRVHSRGLWSNMSLAERLDDIFAMYSAIDCHFHGRYAEEIDRQRRKTVRWLANKVPSHVQQKSAPHRIVREFVRPIRQLWARIQRLGPRAEQAPSMSSKSPTNRSQAA